MLILRWGQCNESHDLVWTGVGIMLVGLGAGLVGGRYFGASYFMSVALANTFVLTGIAFLVQGVRAADGMALHPWILAIPALVWNAASMNEAFRDDLGARLWLFGSMSGVMSIAASLHLYRGGLALPGRKVSFALWVFVTIALCMRMIDASGMLPGLESRYAASILHVAYLSMCAAAIVGLGYVNLALSDALPRLGNFTARLQQAMGGFRRLPPRTAATENQFIWSLRLDRLFMARALVQDFSDRDIENLAGALTLASPGPTALQRTGADRLIWISCCAEDHAKRQFAEAVRAISALSGRRTFPRLGLSLGVAPFTGGDLAAAAAAADRNAVFIRPTPGNA